MYIFLLFFFSFFYFGFSFFRLEYWILAKISSWIIVNQASFMSELKRNLARVIFGIYFIQF